MRAANAIGELQRWIFDERLQDLTLVKEGSGGDLEKEPKVREAYLRF
ncbi:hypothetical protein [Desulfoglaeba alkanexedens]|jgi:hypothetical protein|nr:hypothetical protein [Desulfoglaeba alkanexedens]